MNSICACTFEARNRSAQFAICCLALVWTVRCNQSMRRTKATLI
jgi:hypothetical protein